MNFRKHLKRFLIVLLCLFFISFEVFSSYTKTKAVVPVVAFGGAIIASFLAAAGVSLSANNISSTTDMNDLLNNLANQYSDESGVTSIETELAVKDAYNFYYADKAGDAMVSVSERFSTWLDGFKNWFVNKFALTDSGDSVIVNSTVLDLPDGKFPFYPDRSIFVNGNVPISLVPIVTGVTDIPITDSFSAIITVGEPYDYYGHRVQISIQGYNPNTDTFSGNFSHIYVADQAGSFDFVKIYFGNYNGNLTISMAPDDWGDYTVWNYGYFTNISISSLDTSFIGLSGSLTDGYDDFEQALTDAQSDAGATGQVGINAGEVDVDKPYTQEKIADAILQNTIANTGVGTLVGGYADEKEVEEENDTERLPTGAEIGENIVVVDGLEDFFPFCIPWDLYSLVEKLNVPAEAPVFDLDIGFAGLFTKETVHIDFSAFDTAALIFRTCVLIGFAIFLIIKTRDLIRG